MNLTVPKKINDAIKNTSFSNIAIVGIMVIAFCITVYMLYEKAVDSSNNVIVIDTRGRVYEASQIDQSYMLQFEYEDHVKNFVGLWYAIDENNYKHNIEAALYLIGDAGKQLLNQYNDLNLQNTLMKENIRYRVSIQNIEIDMKSLPVSGRIEFIQTGYRLKGELSREVVAFFTLREVSRSRENSHGVVIDQWETKYKIIKQKTDER